MPRPTKTFRAPSIDAPQVRRTEEYTQGGDCEPSLAITFTLDAGDRRKVKEAGCDTVLLTPL